MVLGYNHSFYKFLLNTTVLGTEYALVSQEDKASTLIMVQVCLGKRLQTNEKISDMISAIKKIIALMDATRGSNAVI